MQVVYAKWNVSGKTGQNTFLFYNIWQKDFSANIYKYIILELYFKIIRQENKFYIYGFLEENLY